MLVEGIRSLEGRYEFNSLDEGGYFDGLPVDCPADDDVAIAVGADNDPNIEVALSYFATGACPVTGAQFGQQRVHVAAGEVAQIEWRGSAQRQYAGAY